MAHSSFLEENSQSLNEAISPHPSFRGYHVLLDYTGLKSFKTPGLTNYFKTHVVHKITALTSESQENIEVSPDRMVAETIFQIIFEALIENDINVVFKKLVVFEDCSRDLETRIKASSPPGFTSVILLDESHATAHCYSEMGLLAIDCFTCGGNPQVTKNVAAKIHQSITSIFPEIESRLHLTHRFPYNLGPYKSSPD